MVGFSRGVELRRAVGVRRDGTWPHAYGQSLCLTTPVLVYSISVVWTIR